MSAVDVLNVLGFIVPIAAFTAVGTLIVRRRPGDRIGRLLLVIGVLLAVVIVGSAISSSSTVPTGVARWAWVASWVWVTALGLLGIQLPLRLPDGELPSPRWHWFSRTTLVLIAAAQVGMMTVPGRISDTVGTPNPIGSDAVASLHYALFGVVLCFFGGIAATVVRYRRAHAHERAQLRWVALGGAVFLGTYMLAFLVRNVLGVPDHSAAADILDPLGQMMFAALPIGIGYAILRHRLYDIDVVINRALVYTTLTLALGAAYLGTVLLLQLALEPLTSDSQFAVAASTLAVAALFRPARAQIQSRVDRRFFRRRYDAARTLAAFATRLRDEVALDELSRELRAVIGETIEPAHVALWLAPRPVTVPGRPARRTEA
jgi:hypothetical protein